MALIAAQAGCGERAANTAEGSEEGSEAGSTAIEPTSEGSGSTPSSGSTEGPSSEGTTDATTGTETTIEGSSGEGTTEVDVPAALEIEIRNASDSMHLYLESCPRCGVGFEVWEPGGVEPLLRASTVLHCLCPDCTSGGCLGIADPPVGWIEVPPAASTFMSWDAMTWESAEMGCTDGGGCLAGMPVASGTYELRIHYTHDDADSEERPCPSGGAKLVHPQDDGTTVVECDELCIPNACPSDPSLASTEIVEFAWPQPGPLLVEL